jgi:hypothetical protein
VFTPNQWCTITPPSGRNLYGEDIDGKPVREGCAIVQLLSKAQATNSRAQLAGSQTHAEDLVITGKIKLAAKTIARLGDKLTAAGTELRVISITPKFTTFGELDHFDVEGTPWV